MFSGGKTIFRLKPALLEKLKFALLAVKNELLPRNLGKVLNWLEIKSLKKEGVFSQAHLARHSNPTKQKLLSESWWLTVSISTLMGTRFSCYVPRHSVIE